MHKSTFYINDMYAIEKNTLPFTLKFDIKATYCFFKYIERKLFENVNMKRTHSLQIFV